MEHKKTAHFYVDGAVATERQYNAIPTMSMRQRCYLYLVDKAFKGETTNYEDIAVELGLPRKGNALGAALSPILCDIFIWCQNNNLGYLTSIVVRKSGTQAGLPGNGFWVMVERHTTIDCSNTPEKLVLTRLMQQEVFRYFRGLED